MVLGNLSPTAGGGGKIPPGKIPSPTVNLLAPPGFLGERVIGGFPLILARIMRRLFLLVEVLLVADSWMVPWRGQRKLRRQGLLPSVPVDLELLFASCLL